MPQITTRARWPYREHLEVETMLVRTDPVRPAGQLRTIPVAGKGDQPALAG
jgi:hypothetical protein